MSMSFQRLFQLICLLIHPPSFHKQSKALNFIITILNKAQELEMIKDANQSYGLYMNTISLIIGYCFGINSINRYYIGVVVILFLLLHILVLILIIYFGIKNNITIQTVIYTFLINYTSIFYIPVVFTSLSIIFDSDYLGRIFGDSYNIGFVLFSIINFGFAIMICGVHIYFARCERLMEDNNILKLDHPIIVSAVSQVLLLCTIILRVIPTQQVTRVILLLLKSMIYIVSSLRYVNEKQYIVIDCISSMLSIVIACQLSLFDGCLICLIFIVVIMQFHNLIISFFITTKDLQNFTTIQVLNISNIIQIIEQCLENGSSAKSKIILSIINYNYQNVRKSRKNPLLIADFLLRKMTNIKSIKLNKNVLIYCQYISNNAPLKGLTKLISVMATDIYYQSSYHNLSQELSQRTKQFQAEAHQKYGKRNKSEHINYLDVESVYYTSHTAVQLFPLLIETLKAKINFWNRLINGYTTIDILLEETLKTTEKMLKCKNAVEERFDLENNRLKIASSSDVLSLRILQIFYSGIYTNSFLAYTLEKSIEDLLKSERFRQEESLDNIKLAQNRLIILKTSFVRKRGELIDVNAKQLGSFLNEKEETAKTLKHCSELMPGFLSTIHDNLMENYIFHGYTKLMIHGESTFYQNMQGFLEPCSINLFNFYDGKDDFILNLILSKELSNYETILFGIDGKILGFTKAFYEQALIGTITGQLKQQTELQVQGFIEKNPLITFYIPQIIIQTYELREQILSSQNFQINNLKSQWIIPDNHQDCLQNSSLILSQFKRKSGGSNSQNLQSYKSQTNSRYSQQSQNTQVENYDDKNFSSETKKSILIDEIPIILLHPDYQEYIARLVNFRVGGQKQLDISYSLQYKTLKYKRGSYGYFMIQMKEFKPIQPTTSFGIATTSGQTQMSTDPPQLSKSQFESKNFPSSDSQQPGSDIKSERSVSKIELVQEVKQMTNLYQNDIYFQDSNNNSANRSKLNSFSNSKLISQQLKSTDRGFESEQLTLPQPTLTQYTKRCNSNLLLQSQFTVQPLYVRPKLFDQQILQEFNDMENEMNQIEQKQVKIEELDKDPDIDYDDDKIESNSRSDKKKSSILENFKKTQQLKKTENVADFHSSPSRTSTSSTSKEALSIVQQLYDNTALIVPLKKIAFILTIACLGMFIINIINVVAIDSNLTNQITQIDDVRKPLNINFFYTTSIFQLLGNHLSYIGLLDASPYMKERMKVQLDYFYEYGRSIMQDHIVDVPILAEKIDITTFSSKMVQNTQRITVNTSLHEFYSIFYENSEEIYRRNLNCTQNCEYTELYTDGFLRQNLVVMMEFHSTLIDAITASTLKTQSRVKTDFLQIMLAEMVSVLFFIGIQLKIWIFMDHITKSILFLVSRLNENQSIEQISKLTMIKQQLEEESNNEWKLFNFSEAMFELSEKKQRKIIQITKKESEKSQTYKLTTALYSRIQRTQYINRINVFITFIIAISWTLYLMSGYLIHMQKNDDFQPSLEVTLKMVKFRQSFDGAAILAGFIQIEKILPGNDLQFINETYNIEQFIKLKDNLSPIINDMANVVLENANKNNQKSRFDDILNSDLCLSSNTSVLPFCDPEALNLQYYEKDDYRTIIKNGFLGFTAAFIKYIDQDYNYEMTNLLYNPEIDESQQDINSPQFNNFLLQYMSDIVNCMRQFLVLLQEENTSIAQSIVNIVQAYYLGFGICLFTAISILSIIWIANAQRQMNSLMQILVLIPLDLILSANIRSQAKEIHSLLF